MPSSTPSVKAVFDRAVEIESPADREAYLDAVCAGAPDVRHKVEALLRAYAEAGSFLEPPSPTPPDATGAFVPAAGTVDVPGGAAGTGTFDPDATGAAAPPPDFPGKDEHAGAVIAGKYTLVEVIGEGGMGSVWRAKQTEPVKRFVAVKLIKAGMDSKQVLARFDAERQALAMMDHPNIAKVLDGGLHDSRPFFVMELVKGVPITEYCDANKLTPQERLELFVQACQAIQHAHQKGIIHRDIKPSNVLVALYDDKPVVKVIDFGVAKATGGTLTEATIDTGFGGVVGTPQYMSPEQATFNNLDIDTRSDVYALGVLLYELLAGSPPFSSKELQKKGLLEILRVVREEEPPRPSTKLSTADALPSLSANRGTEPKKLTGLLRNELDWIVMKALEKDRTRRYETANGFAADVQRYLAGEPVVAHPPTVGYRLKKFVRRNRGQVLAASLVLFTLLAGFITASYGFYRADRERERAEGAERRAVENATKAMNEAEAKDIARAEEARQRSVAEAETKLAGERLEQVKEEKQKVEEQRQKAEEEKRIAQAVQDFLQNKLLSQADVLNQAEILLERGQSSGQAKANPTIRELLDRAAGELTEARIEANFPRQPVLQAAILHTVGRTYCGVGEYERAVGFLERSRRLRQQHLGSDHPDTIITMGTLAQAYVVAGKHDLALPLSEHTLKVLREKWGPNHPGTLASMNNLAMAYQNAGKLDLALPLFEESLRLQKAKLGGDHRDTLTSMNNLAMAYRDAGKLDLALPLFEETLKVSKAKLGAEHPHTLASMNNLAMAYQNAGKLNLAVPLLEESLRLLRSKLGADHPNTLTCMGNLALAYEDSGKRDLATPLHEETLKLKKWRLGADHPETLGSMNNLAMAYLEVGKRDLALPLLEETLKLTRAKLGAEHPNTFAAMNNLAKAYSDCGRRDLAIPLLEESLRLTRAKSGAGPMPTLILMHNLAKAYSESGRFAEAQVLAKELLAIARKTLPRNSPQYAQLLVAPGWILLLAREFTEAEPILRECLAIREKAEPDAWTTFNTHSLLGGALLGQKKYADAEPLLVKGYEGMKAREKSIPPEGAIRVPEALDRLIELYTATNKPDEVKKYKELREKYPTAKEVAPQPREKQ